VWGILGALVMRGIMIWLGLALVERFDFILYIFGAFLLVAAWNTFFARHDEQDIGKSLVMRLCRKSVRVTNDFYGADFTAKLDNRWMLTPLALVLIVIDVTDLVFAVDSIPAVFAITRDPFIVYTSNICAIIGLRSLYFLLAKLIDRFVYLRIGLGFVLSFVGLKMITADYFRVPTLVSLAVIVLILALTIILSTIVTQKRTATKSQK